MSNPSAQGLRSLVSPRTVAIVGASNDPLRLAGRPVRFLLDAKFGGRIFPVNPRYGTVQGLPAWPGIEALPETPEVALIVVSAAGVRQAVADCARRGVGAVYLLSGGYAEVGPEGQALQDDVQAIAAGAGMRVLGPNCLGAFDAQTGFFGTFTSLLQDGGIPFPGPVAIVSQSGAYGMQLAYLMNRRGVGVRWCITTGNEIDVDSGECMAWLAGEPDVRVIAVYAESVRNGASFMAGLAKARAMGKRVVMLKAGGSAAGARAAASHTAALAGSDAVLDAVLRQHGACRVRSTEEQVDVACACARAPAPAGRRIGIASISGGFGVMAADAADRAGLDVAPLPAEAQHRLREILPFGGITNPVDVTGQAVNDLSMFSRALQILVDAGVYDALIVSLTTTPLTTALAGPIREVLSSATRAYRATRPVVLVMVGRPDDIAAYEADGFLVFEDTQRAVNALAAMAPSGLPAGGAAPVERPRGAGAPALPAGDAPLSEVQAKAVLRGIGLATPHEETVTSADAAVAAAQAAGGPVAMKIVSPDIAHKTEIGGVLLGVQGDPAVRDGFAELMRRARAACPGARLDGVLVSAMAPAGVEVLLGVQNDPSFGPVIVFGLGGVTAELFKDVSMRAAPVDAQEARRMIGETRAARLLAGWRGQGAADVDALARAIVALSELAADNAGVIGSIDVNPLRVLPAGQGVLALDAVIVRAGQGGAATHQENHE